MIQEVKNNDIKTALMKLKSKMKKENTLEDYYSHTQYTKPSVARVLKSKKASKQRRKDAEIAARKAKKSGKY